MIMWILSTVLTSAVAVLVSAPFIWRYAVRHSAAAFEARAQADQMKPVEDGGALNPIDANRPPSAPIEIERPPLADNRVLEAPRPHLSNFTRTWAAVAITSGLVVLGFVGIYALTRDQPPSADPSSSNRSLLLPASQSATPLRNLQLFSKNPSSADRLLDQLRAVCAESALASKEHPRPILDFRRSMS